MKNVQAMLISIFCLIGAVSHLACADSATDPFEGIASKYRAAKNKPPLPEDARKYRVQAEFAVQKKQFDKALEFYGEALEIAPWWPEGHFNRALILGETEKYWDAISEMKRYLLLVPNASDARVAQDKIYQWESVGQIKDCPDCPEMVVIPAGSFNMEEYTYTNPLVPVRVAHRVIIAKPFAIGKTEVTQGQWKAIMGNNPSDFQLCGDTCPVENVSWKDAQAFIQNLNAKSGKQYRLPSEAEWEYACRGGAQQQYCGSDNVDSVAWYKGSAHETEKIAR